MFWETMAMVVLAIGLGLVVNQFRPGRLPLVGDWSAEARLTLYSDKSMVIPLGEARKLCEENKVVFLDARSPGLYDQGHIRCALNIPWQGFDKYVDRVFETIPEDTRIVTYCDGEHCSLSEDLAKELVAMGYQNVNVLLNGWARWVEAGLPVEKGHEGHPDVRKG
ncbi:MAG: rhodanese-like domain-containing protein [Deltaproteobacteria bacterium]|nr:rhodanese-like domain-containing protein [Deltaproteobacteria bacterium]